MNHENNPMHLFQAPRCGAKTRAGTPCNAPAIHGRKRCRMHGGASPGAPKGNQNAWRNGKFTAKAMSDRRELHALLSELKRLIQQTGK